MRRNFLFDLRSSMSAMDIRGIFYTMPQHVLLIHSRVKFPGEVPAGSSRGKFPREVPAGSPAGSSRGISPGKSSRGTSRGKFPRDFPREVPAGSSRGESRGKFPREDFPREVQWDGPVGARQFVGAQAGPGWAGPGRAGPGRAGPGPVGLSRAGPGRGPASSRVRRTWRATDLVFFLDLHSMYMFATIKSDTKRNSAKLV
jgi:hypothetical protein